MAGSQSDYDNFVSVLKNEIRKIKVGQRQVYAESWVDLKDIGGH